MQVLPLTNPLRVAEEVATLDQISKGRLDFGVGRSGLTRYYRGYNVDYSESSGRFLEAMDRSTSSGRRNRDNLHFLSVFRDGGEPLTLPGVASAKDQGFDIPSIDQVWYAHTSPGVPKDRVERLRGIFDKAFSEDNLNVMRKQTGRPGLLRIPPKDLLPILDDSYKLAVKFKGELKG